MINPCRVSGVFHGGGSSLVDFYGNLYHSLLSFVIIHCIPAVPHSDAVGQGALMQQ